VILFNSRYWEGFLDWLKSTVLDKGCISEEDLDLLRVCDHPDEVIEAVQKWYTKQEVLGRKALLR
jgi:predicted Rossmann-fold nucleotide-binding protein